MGYISFMSIKRQELSGSFDSLYNLLCGVFNKVKDPRQSNASYELTDLLKMGFAMFSLKSPSVLNFIGRTKSESENLGNIYKVGAFTSENGLRQGLDKVVPDGLRLGFVQLWKRIKKLGILDQYRYWRGHLTVSVDGVEHFCSGKVHCDCCLERKHKDGKIGYRHAMLSAVLVHPEQQEVFVMDNEPVIRQDGSNKNDCERNAAQRLLDNIVGSYSKERLVWVMDSLYSCGPIVRTLEANPRWQYVLGVKPDGNKSLFSQFEGRDQRGQVKWVERQIGEATHRFGYTNGLALNTANSDLRVNMLYYEEKRPNKKPQVFSWATSISLTKANVEKVMRMGRARWKIENETFNTLKNQGYNFEHNYGHGKKHLCTVFALLMMMAFTLDQVQQHACSYFKKLWVKLKTKAKLWENIRAAFKILTFDSMKQLFFKVAEINLIQLE